MLLDFTSPWGIIRRSDGSAAGEAAAFAAAELAAVLGRMTGAEPEPAAASRESRIFVLDSGSAARGPGGPRRGARFSWRASEDQVELYGEDGPALVQAVYGFLRALGARWVAPGPDGERLTRGARLELADRAGASAEGGAAAVLALGHGAFLEDWERQLTWAARLGYSSILILVTTDPLALGAAPLGLYERLRPGIAALARRTGLAIELGGLPIGPLGWSATPGASADAGGRVVRAAADAAALAAELAAAFPEVTVFHAWPDELPGGGWRAAPPRRGTRAIAGAVSTARPLGEALAGAVAFADALAAARPGAAVSFLARPGDLGPDANGAAAVFPADLASALAAGGRLPPNLELLWAPRGRSRSRALRDSDGAAAPQLEAFGSAARAWKEAGGGRIAVLERWEDGLLYKCAVPPMTRAMSGDIAAYREAGAEAVGLLRGGCRLPLAPRPGACLAPAMAGAAVAADRLLADWAGAVYAGASAPMLKYWRELEEAWAIGMDVDEDETGVRDSGYGPDAAKAPPADWGDPWRASVERLAARRERCEELFDRLRAAERALEEARSAAEGEGPARAAVRSEADEYAVSGSVLELECARLSVYHELAAGEARAAADIANLALSASDAAKDALGRVPDRRSRAEGRFIIRAFYDLGIRAVRRGNARSSLRRALDLRLQAALAARAAARVRRAFE